MWVKQDVIIAIIDVTGILGDGKLHEYTPIGRYSLLASSHVPLTLIFPPSLHLCVYLFVHKIRKLFCISIS